MNSRHFVTPIMAFLLAWMFAGCSGEDSCSPPLKDGPCVYSMRLIGQCNGFDASTRAYVEWAEGDIVYLCLTDEAGKVDGKAEYHAGQNKWTITTKRPILSMEGNGLAYYFDNPESVNDTKVSLSSSSVIYTDGQSSYEMHGDDEIWVRAAMTPVTGRIRFRGQPGQRCAVSGLSLYTSYSISTRTFSKQAAKITPKVNQDGYTDFHYMFFQGERQLVVDHTASSCFLYTFPESMLAEGTSGHVTLPTVEEPGYWILSNSQNLQPITLPEVGNVTMEKVRSQSAMVSAPLNAAGNGTISATGFIYSYYASPTVENGILVKVSLTDGMMKGTLTGLLPETRYYVRAFATNEKGTALGTPQVFTTISRAEDGTIIENPGYGDDESLDDSDSSDGNIGKDDYGEDESLDEAGSSEGDIGKVDFGEDEDFD